MNKKIKDLAGTALDTSVPHTWTTLTAYDLDRFTEKFAQLLVDEVYSYINNDTLDDNPFPSRRDVKQHFGVGE